MLSSLPGIALAMVASSLVAQTPTGAGRTVSDVAVAHRRPSGGPHHSDVCFSIRWMRKEVDPFETAKTFHGTRFDWVYATEAFIKDCKRRGYPTCHSTSSARTDIGKPEGKPTSYTVGRAIDIHGKPLIASWQNWNPPWGCASNPDFLDLLFHDVKLAVDAGAGYMQIDDPDTTIMLRWGGDKNDPQTRGCFCSHCLTTFRKYLARELKLEALEALGVRDVARFDYQQYVLGGNRNAALRKHFETSYRRTVEAFWRTLIERAARHAGRHFPFACNNTSFTRWDAPHHLFDFGVGELSKYDPPSPQSLWRKALVIDSMQKAQVYTLRSTNVAYTRRVLGLSYAVGNHFLVPWDVWVGGSDRFFGKPQDFKDLYAFVRANARWLATYEYAAAYGEGVRDKWYGEGLPGVVAFLAPESPRPARFPTVYDADLGQFTTQTALAAIDA